MCDKLNLKVYNKRLYISVVNFLNILFIDLIYNIIN